VSLFCRDDVKTTLNVEAVDDEADIDEDALIADYLASQLGDFDCELDAQTMPREWPKGRGSKLLDQTLCVHHDSLLTSYSRRRQSWGMVYKR